jgi:hypothetical protein
LIEKEGRPEEDEGADKEPPGQPGTRFRFQLILGDILLFYTVVVKKRITIILHYFFASFDALADGCRRKIKFSAQLRLADP